MKSIINVWNRREWRPHSPNPEPNPELPYIKITFKVAEYQSLINEIRYRDNLSEEFWKNVPDYLIARCPICHGVFTARVDTHSLKLWFGTNNNNSGRYVFSQNEEYQDISCKHFLGVHSFLNLNGIFPEEKSNYFQNEYDVPFVSPLFLPDEVQSYVVMHNLPICRIEEGKFVPCYTLYTLTYFVAEEYVAWVSISNASAPIRRGVIFERRAAERLDPDYDAYEFESFLYPVSNARKHPDWWDLPLWVERKKLLWLVPYSPELPLRDGPVKDFPYPNIQGYRRPILIRNGKFRFQD